MILTCPRCATRYLVDANQLWTTGRTVQCDACGQRWRASGSGAPPAPRAPPPVDIAPRSSSEIPWEILSATPAEAVAADAPPAEPDPAAEMQAEPEAETKSETIAPTETVAPEESPRLTFTPLDPPPAVPPPARAEPEPALFLQKRPRAATPTAFATPGVGRALAILVLLATVVVVLVLFHDPIVRAAPALAPIYSALGLSKLSLMGVGAHG